VRHEETFLLRCSMLIQQFPKLRARTGAAACILAIRTRIPPFDDDD
jgi:hypothetical protein